MIQLGAYRHTGLLCRLYHDGTDLFKRRYALMQLRMRDDHGRTEFLRRVDHSEQTFQVGRVEGADRTFPIFRYCKDFLQVNKHL